MVLFGLGTLPVMLGISLTGHLLPAAIRLQLARLVPAGVVVIAALLILRGLSLGIPYLSPDLAAGPSANCACHSR
jgi:sulfite exporter TauE/SafE